MNDKTVRHLLNILRQGTVTWSGRAECLKRYSKKRFQRFGQKGQKIFKTYWRCGICSRWYRDVDSLEVDHIEEIGSFDGDFNEYIERMYCPQHNLMAVCIACHKKKTGAYNSANTKYVRK